MELNRLYKINQRVYIFADYIRNGLPQILSGVVVGVIKQRNGIYNFIYRIESENVAYYRFPDAIFVSEEEVSSEIKNFIVK